MHLRSSILLLLTLVALSCTAPRTTSPPLAQTDPELTIVITRAIAWEKYWATGESADVIRNEARTRGPMTTWTTASEKDGTISVFIDELMWRIDLSQDAAGHWQADWVNRDQWIDSYESSKQSAAKKAGKLLQLGVVCMAPDAVEAAVSSQSSGEERRKIEQMVRSVAESQEFFRKDRPRRGAKLWISWATPGIPHLYYHVEGSDYLGTIEYESPHWKVVHDDLEIADYYYQGTGARYAFDRRRIVDRLHWSTEPLTFRPNPKKRVK